MISRKMEAIKKAESKQKRCLIEAENRSFMDWRKMRLFQVCRLLRLLDQLIPLYPPFSDEQCVAVEMMIQNERKYQVLASGTREEQEEMRRQDE